MRMVYDTLIIGGGPCGYTAALYAGRADLKILVLEKGTAGGQMSTTDHIDNYPGFPDGTDGYSLASAMERQAARFGAQTVQAEVQKVQLDGPVKTVTAGGKDYCARTVIVAAGASPRELGFEEERRLRGKGVSYCATCDGVFYRGKTVAVVGGGDTAAVDALFLTRFCEKVYVVHRRDALRAAKEYQKRLFANEKVELIWDSVVERILADGNVTGLRLRNKKTGEIRELPCQGVFIAIGSVPNTAFLEGQLPLDEEGYVMAGEDTATPLAGVFAAGDIRRKAFRQIVTAVSDGATAAKMAEESLMHLRS